MMIRTLGVPFSLLHFFSSQLNRCVIPFLCVKKDQKAGATVAQGPYTSPPLSQPTTYSQGGTEPFALGDSLRDADGL